MTTEKRKPKGEIKYNISLNSEQREVKRLIEENEIVIITGKAGSGKTLSVAHTILNMLFRRDCEKVWITRPTQQVGDSLGFLPGGLDDKLDPYLDPFVDNLYKIYDRSKVDSTIADKKIEGTAIQFIRGKTFSQGQILVVDEVQNCTKTQISAILTRLGVGGKIILIGDIRQKDTRDKLNGLSYVLQIQKDIPEIIHIDLKENHRSGLVAKIIEWEDSHD